MYSNNRIAGTDNIKKKKIQFNKTILSKLSKFYIFKMESYCMKSLLVVLTFNFNMRICFSVCLCVWFTIQRNIKLLKNKDKLRIHKQT